jgi:type 1 glutamine amidotransferase/HEAT repeat protein
MRTARLAIAAIISLAVIQAACAASQIPVLILTGQNNHDWKATTPVLKEILEQNGGFRVDVNTEPSRLGLETFKRYRAIISNYNGPRWGEKTEKALLEYVKNGGGLAIIHAANNAFPDWPEYDRLIGGAWREGAGHGKQHRFRVVISDHNHPITQGMPDFMGAVDELYHRMKMQPDAHVLATTYSAPDQNGTGRDEPIAWVVQYGKGRVFQNVQGHGAEAMRATGFSLLLRRGTEWAATGKVARPVSPAEAAVLALGEKRGFPRYEAKTRLIAMAGQAVPALFEAFALHDTLCGDDARDALLWIAQRWAGSPSGREKVSRAIMEYALPGKPSEVRQFAIRLLGIIGKDESLYVISLALKDDSVRDEAVAALVLIPGPKATSDLLSYLPRASVRDTIPIIHALGTRRDKAALPALAAAARDRKGKVQLAAIEAVGRIGDSGSLSTLEALVNAGPADVKNASLDAQLAIADHCLRRGALAPALKAYDRVLADAQTDQQRLAALSGLGAVASSASVKTLVAYLNDPARPRLQAAAARALRAIPGPEATQALLDALKMAQPQVLVPILAALGERRDPAAVPAIAAAAASPEEPVRLTAIRALGEIGGRESAAVLLAAMSSESEAVKSAAIKAAIKVANGLAASREPADKEQAAAVYAQAFDAASNDVQRIAALSGLGRVAMLQAIQKIESVVDTGTGAVRDAAFDALIQSCDAISSTNPQEARRLYTKALNILPAGPRSLAVAQKLKALGAGIDLAALQGFVTDWWIIGPFPNAKGSAAYDIAYFPENEIALGKTYQVEGRALQWKFHHTDDLSGVVDLLALIQPNEDMAAYAYAEVTAPAAQDGILLCGSDDGIVVWVNGKRVQGVNQARGLRVDEDSAPIHLVQGTNKILVKVLNGSADWEFCLRLTDANRNLLRLPSRRP